MKFTSALFLVLLLVQSTICQSDNIQMIQKSEEGREVLDNLFLQVSLKGENFNPAVVQGILKQMETTVRANLKERATTVTDLKSDCKAELATTRNSFHQLTARALASTRNLQAVESRQKRRGVFLARAEEELAHYAQFEGWVKANGKAWDAFYKATQTTMENTIGMLASVDTHVESLADHGGAFVELPNSYSSNLAQISNKFEQTYDNLGGLRAVITNVLQLIQKKEVVSQSALREKVHSVIRHVSDRLNDFTNSLAEQNEHQTSMFESLESLFNDAVVRSTKLVAVLKAQSVHAETKVGMLNTMTKGTDGLAAEARNVVTQLGNECRSTVQRASRMDIRAMRLLSVVGNLRDVVTERFATLSAFFIEKMNQK
jgi:hypothetical protein